MNAFPFPQPSLYRVAVGVLAIASAANVLLWRLAREDDTFANIIAAVSGIVAVVLVLSGPLGKYVPSFVRWREEALVLALAVWLANFIEYAIEDAARWESRIRQCGFYGALAGLALGAYLAQRLERQER